MRRHDRTSASTQRPARTCRAIVMVSVPQERQGGQPGAQSTGRPRWRRRAWPRRWPTGDAGAGTGARAPRRWRWQASCIHVCHRCWPCFARVNEVSHCRVAERLAQCCASSNAALTLLSLHLQDRQCQVWQEATASFADRQATGQSIAPAGSRPPVCILLCDRLSQGLHCILCFNLLCAGRASVPLCEINSEAAVLSSPWKLCMYAYTTDHRFLAGLLAYQRTTRNLKASHFHFRKYRARRESTPSALHSRQPQVACSGGAQASGLWAGWWRSCRPPEAASI